MKEREEGIWTLYFDGSVAKIGAGACVCIIYTIKEFESLSYQLNFECTNNVAEYEALLLGLHALKDKKVKRVLVIRDSYLVINQINDIYQTRNPRMRAYRNEVWDMFDNFFIEYAVKVVPRTENTVVYFLAVAAGKFGAPTAKQKEHKVYVRNRPAIPNNSRHWKVFEDNEQIKIFMELSDEFSNT